MGLFDKIKKAFTADVKEEPQVQEPDLQDTDLTPDDEEATEGVTTEASPETAAPKTEEASEADSKAQKPEEVVETIVIEEPQNVSEEAEPEVTEVIEEIVETSEPDLDDAVSETAEPVVEPAETITITTAEPEETAEWSVPEEIEILEEADNSQSEETYEPEAQEEADESGEGVEEPVQSELEATVHQKYDQGLAKTRKSFGEKMNELFARFRRVDEAFFEELEETLIGADVGFETAINLTESLRNEVKLKNAKKPSQVQNVIVEKLVEIYEEGGMDENNALNIQPNGLTVILFVGVNGTGKTTSIGKLAHQYQMEGKKVLLAAADTFRAGAIDQLVVWGERSGVEVVHGKAGGDPAAVVYDAVEQAQAGNYDILLVDTAGRLQNKVNLMNELAKINRIIQREIPDAPHEVLLVVDATTGQNALVQARQFKEATDVTGIVLTKLDGTAKGGIVLAIRNELHLPVKMVGLGEGINDLEPFDSNEFAIGLFKGLLKEE